MAVCTEVSGEEERVATAGATMGALWVVGEVAMRVVSEVARVAAARGLAAATMEAMAVGQPVARGATVEVPMAVVRPGAEVMARERTAVFEAMVEVGLEGENEVCKLAARRASEGARAPPGVR